MKKGDYEKKRLIEPIVRQCKAKSHQSGERCKKSAMLGQHVCRSHGGAAPQNLAKARRRLLALADPAIGRLSSVIEKGEDAPAVRASLGVLDRTIGKLTKHSNLDIQSGAHEIDIFLFELLAEKMDAEKETPPIALAALRLLSARLEKAGFTYKNSRWIVDESE